MLEVSHSLTTPFTRVSCSGMLEVYEVYGSSLKWWKSRGWLLRMTSDFWIWPSFDNQKTRSSLSWTSKYHTWKLSWRWYVGSFDGKCRYNQKYTLHGWNGSFSDRKRNIWGFFKWKIQKTPRDSLLLLLESGLHLVKFGKKKKQKLSGRINDFEIGKIFTYKSPSKKEYLTGFCRIR